jgi:hypothetical protein
MGAIVRRLNDHGVGISASQVWRRCRSLDFKPWQTESWMTSHDPEFWEKAPDVCGLYPEPPDDAIVWSVDEKTGIRDCAIPWANSRRGRFRGTEQ